MLNLNDKIITEVMPVIGAKAFAVLMAISKHLNKESKAFPSVKRIMFLTKLGRDSVMSAIKLLKKEGLLIVEKRTDKGRFTSNLYTVNTDLISVFVSAKNAGNLNSKPCTEKQTRKPSTVSSPPCTEKSTSVKSYAENPTLSINNKEVLTDLEVLKREKGETPPQITNEDISDFDQQAPPTPDFMKAKSDKEERKKVAAKKEKKFSIMEIYSIGLAHLKLNRMNDWNMSIEINGYKGTQKEKEAEIFRMVSHYYEGQKTEYKIQSIATMPDTILQFINKWYGYEGTKKRGLNSLKKSNNGKNNKTTARGNFNSEYYDQARKEESSIGIVVHR